MYCVAVAIQTVYSREVGRTTRYLKINDIRKAEHEIICHVQRSTFPEVIKILLSANGMEAARQEKNRFNRLDFRSID